MTTESITIKSVKIDGLFEIFNYDIQYPKDESVLILTGPNGYGKTQVLNILANLFEKNFDFFRRLAFEQIIVTLSNQNAIQITQQPDNEDSVEFVFTDNGDVIERFVYAGELNSEAVRQIELITGLHNLNNNSWFNHTINRTFSISQVLANYKGSLPSYVQDEINNSEIKNPQSIAILDSIDVHLIKEQRLFKQVKRERSHRVAADSTVMIETIETYAKELKQLINERATQSYEISQKLDSSYPTRLISEKRKVTKKDYDEKFARLKQQQDKLVKNGLSETSQKALDYSEDDAKALLVYLDDLEKKLAVFDDLIEKLELFTNILNERRFTFKSINISKDKGFYFKTTTDKDLSLNQLSSGEQHEVVLLFELIFKTSPNILVLIDEPEISLHVTWQKEFLDDLLKIIKLQKFQVLIATHAPAIVNSRWDLVYELNKSKHNAEIQP